MTTGVGRRPTMARESGPSVRWRVLGLNQRRLSRRFYRPLPLTTRATRRVTLKNVTGLGLGGQPRPQEVLTMADSSFDVVSKIDRQEIDNALNQAAKEVSQRFDFRGPNASIEWSGELGVIVKAD